MSLQDLIEWWREYSTDKRSQISCGIWPAALPARVDIYIDCCADHDNIYRDSEVYYARGVVENNEDLKALGLNMKEQGDLTFASCVRERYGRSWLVTRPFTRYWGEKYIELVLANGSRIWFTSVGAKIAAYESGESPVIRAALRRAAHGSYEEERVIKKAYSFPREAEASHRKAMHGDRRRPEDV